MPHVASESRTHALNRPLPLSVRPSPPSVRTQASPFESLLDSAPPPPPPRENRLQKASDDDLPRPDRAQAKPAKSADRPDKAAKSDDTAKPDDTDAPAETATSTDEVKATGDGIPMANAKTDEKTDEKAATGDGVEAGAGSDTKQTTDAKPVNGIAVVEPAAIVTTDRLGTAAKPDAIMAAIAPAARPDTAQAAKPDTTQAPTPETDEPAIVAAGAQKTQPDGLAAPQVKTELQAKTEKSEKQAVAVKATDDSKASTKTAAPSVEDTEPQAAAAEHEPEPNKAATAHARVELKAGGHRDASAAMVGAAGGDSQATTPKITADAAPPAILTAPAHSSPALTATPVAAAHVTPAAVAVPLAGVPIEITSKALAGTNHFEVRLDPPELGRIHVHLDVDRDGNVVSRVIADRSDTLDLLRRDTSGLERALQDAGLKTAHNSLQFSLRDQSANQQQNNGTDTAHLVVEDDQLSSLEATQRDFSRLGSRTGGLDIRV